MSIHLFRHLNPGAPKIMVLHGWGSSTEGMNPLISKLTPTFEIVAFDFPGHGQSPVPATSWGIDEQVELARQVAAKMGFGSYGIVGHSNGGRVALELASRQGLESSLSFLALIAPSGIRRTRSASFYARSWAARLLKAPMQFLPGKARVMGLDWLRHSLLWRALGSSDYQSLTGVMRETFVRTVNHYFDDGLNKVACPTVLFWGENDETITRKQMDTMMSTLPDAGLFVVEGAGHYAHIDQAGIVASGISDLARV